jgi:hypothetical protein
MVNSGSRVRVRVNSRVICFEKSLTVAHIACACLLDLFVSNAQELQLGLPGHMGDQCLNVLKVNVVLVL